MTASCPHQVHVAVTSSLLFGYVMCCGYQWGCGRTPQHVQEDTAILECMFRDYSICVTILLYFLTVLVITLSGTHKSTVTYTAYCGRCSVLLGCWTTDRWACQSKMFTLCFLTNYNMAAMKYYKDTKRKYVSIPYSHDAVSSYIDMNFKSRGNLTIICRVLTAVNSFD